MLQMEIPRYIAFAQESTPLFLEETFHLAAVKCSSSRSTDSQS